MNNSATACLLGISLAVALSAQSPACPTITRSTKLSANCTGPLTVAADNVFLDLGGRTVACTAESPWTGIDVTDRRGVRIENGNVSDCVRGINLVRGGGHSIRKVSLRRANTYTGAVH